jgi:hypothetical protein
MTVAEIKRRKPWFFGLAEVCGDRSYESYHGFLLVQTVVDKEKEWYAYQVQVGEDGSIYLPHLVTARTRKEIRKLCNSAKVTSHGS